MRLVRGTRRKACLAKIIRSPAIPPISTVSKVLRGISDRPQPYVFASCPSANYVWPTHSIHPSSPTHLDPLFSRLTSSSPSRPIFSLLFRHTLLLQKKNKQKPGESGIKKNHPSILNLSFRPEPRQSHSLIGFCFPPASGPNPFGKSIQPQPTKPSLLRAFLRNRRKPSLLPSRRHKRSRIPSLQSHRTQSLPALPPRYRAELRCRVVPEPSLKTRA